jgi:hypothetical protein
LAFAASPAAAALDGHVKYAGRAYAAFVNAPTLGIGPTFVSDTGMLATSGGFASNGLLSFGVQAALSANVAVSVTSGENAVAKSSCAINDLIIFPGSPVEVTASFVRGETEASCSGGLKGTAEFSWLMFGGLMVPVTGLPDQKIMVPGIGTLVINERITTSVGGIPSINANALHLILLTGDEVIIAGAVSGIVGCLGSGPCDDFVTGGGFIGGGNAKKSFGFTLGFHAGDSNPVAQFNYIDHATGMHVKVTTVTIYTPTSTTSRHIEGQCEVDQMGGYWYAIDVADNGEPGAGADTLSLMITNGYTASGTLRGGNIQIHAPCQ